MWGCFYERFSLWSNMTEAHCRGVVYIFMTGANRTDLFFDSSVRWYFSALSLMKSFAVSADPRCYIHPGGVNLKPYQYRRCYRASACFVPRLGLTLAHRYSAIPSERAIYLFGRRSINHAFVATAPHGYLSANSNLRYLYPPLPPFISLCCCSAFAHIGPLAHVTDTDPTLTYYMQCATYPRSFM
jgi:hypothetical protein